MGCHCHESSCCHNEHEENKRKMIFRLALGVIIFLAGLFVDSKVLIFISYLILGYDVLLEAVKDFKHIFNENFLMSIATIGAFIIGEYTEAVAVMLFYQIGETLSDYATNKSKKSIRSLMDMRSDTATVLKDGKLIKTDCCDVLIGDVIVVSAGESVPLDGTIIKGNAYFDTSNLTGESKYKLLSENEKVLSGSINTNSTVHIRVEATLSQSTVSKILELVETNNKSKSEKLITKFAKIYTPVVVLMAALIAILPPLFVGNIKEWFYTAMLFLVVSCPCALVVSVPLTFFAGIGCASKKGILIKGGYALETLSEIKNIAFDKTGTLTEGKFSVTDINSAIDKDEILMYSAYAEFYSPHPIAKAILSAYGKDIETSRIVNYEEVAGGGVRADIDGKKILIGSRAFLEQNKIQCDEQIKDAVFVAIDGTFSGSIIVKDSLKSNAKEAISHLARMNIKSTILTGDTKENAEDIAEKLNSQFYTSLLPQDKVNILKDIKEKGICAFVGDGINDAPVLSNADVGISMGNIGSDAAIEASDIVIMTDDLIKIPLAVKISKKTVLIAKENILFALLIKFIIMLLSIFGIGTMWMAVFADVGVCLIAVLNALRALRIDNNI